MASRGVFWIALAAILIAACAAPRESKVAGPTYYPPLPNAPRIQHLATISSERNLGRQSSALADFVLGDDSGEQRLKQPYGVALYEGRLYVADSRAHGLAVFDFGAHRFSLVTGSGNGRLKRPINVTIDADGTKYVTDTGHDQVLVFDREDRFVRALGVSGQFKPVDCVIAGERLYVVDIAHHKVQVLDKRSGERLFEFGKAGSGDDDLFQPTNLALGPGGDVYVVDTGNYRVQRFGPDGKRIRSYGAVGATLGLFARPKGIAIDREGRMYVGDAAFENIQLFDPEGRLLLFFGQAGDKAESLNLPAGVTIDYEHVNLFRDAAGPGFVVEYLILVASQFGPNKVDVFGFGRMSGMDYPPDGASPARAASKR